VSECTVVSREYVRWLRGQRRAWIARGLDWTGKDPAEGQPDTRTAETDTEETRP
jgi:hypothetical protein